MATKHLILAWIKKNPSHGYVIKKCYRDFINPDENLSDAKLYPLLREMEQEGLITRHTEDRESGPSRKIISITEKGEAAFDDWLRSDRAEGLGPRPRYDFFRAFPFLVKFSYFNYLDPATALEKIEAQRESHAARLADYERAREKMIAKGLADCKVQALEFGIMQEETVLRWLERMADYYENQVDRRDGKTNAAEQGRQS